jgi:hypothetical protein
LWEIELLLKKKPRFRKVMGVAGDDWPSRSEFTHSITSGTLEEDHHRAKVKESVDWLTLRREKCYNVSTNIVIFNFPDKF